MKQVWNRIGLSPAAGQRSADQARLIRGNKWFTEIVIEEIRCRCETINLQEDTDQTLNVAIADQERGAEQCDEGLADCLVQLDLCNRTSQFK